MSRSAGDPTQPAVILLHGFPESHRTWRELVPRLQDRFFLVMPDQRGFAGSDLPQDVEAYKTDTLMDDIFALADALGIEQFALVGHDWGGAIAWASGDPGRSATDATGDRQFAASGHLPEEPDRGRRTSGRRRNILPPSARRVSTSWSRAWLRLVLRQELRASMSTLQDLPRRAPPVYRRLVAAGRVQRDAQLVPGLEGGRTAAGRDGAACPTGCSARSPA